MKKYCLIIILSISLFGCSTPRSLSLQEDIKYEVNNSLIDSLQLQLSYQEQIIRELNMQLSSYKQRIEQSERIIREYDQNGNLIKTDETRNSSIEEYLLQTSLLQRVQEINSLNETINNLRKELSDTNSISNTSIDETITVYKVPKWCWWLLSVNVSILLFIVVRYIYLWKFKFIKNKL